MYASFAHPNGEGIYGRAEAFQKLARFLESGSQIEITLAEPPERVLEAGPVRVLRLLAAGEGPAELQGSGDAIEISGGLDARGKFAATLENLALESVPYDQGEAGPVSRHVDLAYFPGHLWLEETLDVGDHPPAA